MNHKTEGSKGHTETHAIAELIWEIRTRGATLDDGLTRIPASKGLFIEWASTLIEQRCPAVNHHHELVEALQEIQRISRQNRKHGELLDAIDTKAESVLSRVKGGE